MTVIGPLTVPCPRCGAEPGKRCMAVTDWARKPHAARVSLAAKGDPRERLGRLVRETWTEWADEQDHPKLSWLTGWDDLDDGQREVDMRIGAAVAEDERERIRAGVKALARIAVLHDGCPVRVVSQYELEQLIGGGS